MRTAFVLLLAAAAGGPKPAAVSPAERAAASRIRPETIRAHVGILASDLLEGRGPATRGDGLARAYVASQMAAAGLEPGAPGGGWFQAVDVVGVTSAVPDRIRFTRGGEAVELLRHEDFVAYSGRPEPRVSVEAAEVVFVGYGIVAPEYSWDDYKGADLRGKVALIMNNDPESDPDLFKGKTRLYYGRWDYKYEEAARHGAAAAIIIHTIPSAAYPWKVVQTSWGAAEQFALPDDAAAHVAIKAWATDDACKRIARLGGQDLDALRASAERREFRPLPLGVALSLALENRVDRKQTANVIGRIPGRDPALAGEAVIYTAHHDHLGMREARPGQDTIYNGALDNASGVATLLVLCEAMKALPQPPRRTVYFAAVAAEEQGLLGSKYLAAHPPVPSGRIAADINVDGINIWGRSRDVVVIGLGKSNLDDWIRGLAAMQGRVVVPDAFADKGSFYRSDQFSFARIGVPAAYLDAGVDMIGKPEGWGRAQQEAFEATDYHQPSDELRPAWDLSGAVEDAQLLFYLGVKVANAARMPAWKPGDEFEAARKKAIAEAEGSKPSAAQP